MKVSTSLIIITALLVSGGCNLNIPNEAGFKSLFDGETLDGWELSNYGHYHGTDINNKAWSRMIRIEEGALVLDSLSVDVAERPGGAWLATKGKYKDFILRCQMQVDREWDMAGNSGIQVRYDVQFDVHPPNPYQLGWIWEESILSGWVSPVMINWAGMKEKKLGPWDLGHVENAPEGFKFYYSDEGSGWNDIEIVAQGLNFQFKLNGTMIVDYNGEGYFDDEKHRQNNIDHSKSAPIFFQFHGKDGIRIRYKSIRIKEL